jgi:hypothetical protein
MPHVSSKDNCGSVAWDENANIINIFMRNQSRVLYTFVCESGNVLCQLELHAVCQALLHLCGTNHGCCASWEWHLWVWLLYICFSSSPVGLLLVCECYYPWSLAATAKVNRCWLEADDVCALLWKLWAMWNLLDHPIWCKAHHYQTIELLMCYCWFSVKRLILDCIELLLMDVTQH